MLGSIAGDVIGSIYERRAAPENFPLFSDSSRYTDDTVLTIATAAVLNKHDSPTATDFAESYIQYYQEYPNRGFGSGFKVWASIGDVTPVDSYGNGAAMRVSPVAWAYDGLEDIRVGTLLTAFFTHNNIEAFRGARTVTAATYLARKKKSKSDISKYIRTTYGYTLKETSEELNAQFKFSSCQATVPLAIQAFLKGDDFEGVIREAIAFGGDSDTIAAMAGSIAEAYYGIPDEIVKETRSRLPEEFISVIDEFYEKYI